MKMGQKQNETVLNTTNDVCRTVLIKKFDGLIMKVNVSCGRACFSLVWLFLGSRRVDWAHCVCSLSRHSPRTLHEAVDVWFSHLTQPVKPTPNTTCWQQEFQVSRWHFCLLEEDFRAEKCHIIFSKYLSQLEQQVLCDVLQMCVLLSHNWCVFMCVYVCVCCWLFY